MSTKVKGEAIKEGSIPLSALDKDFQKNLKIDWKNITNSPFGESAGAGHTINCNYVEYKNGYYYFKLLYVDPYLIQTVVGNGFTKYNDVLKSKYIILQIGDENIPEYKADIVNINYDGTDHIMIVRTKHYGDYFNSPEEAAEFIANTTSDMGDRFIAKLPSVFVEQELSDWNANEGEEGYIKNRTHSVRIINPVVVSDNLIEYNWNTYYNKVYIRYDADLVRTLYLPYGDSMIINGNDFFGITDYNILIRWDGDSYIRIEFVEGGANDFADSLLRGTTVGEYVQLQDIFLSDTVLKTTPQTLSDSAKNQALTNLGIDPVVWKYMCEPVVIDAGAPEGTFPEELISIIFDDDGNLKPIVQNLIVFVNNPIRSWSGNEVYYSDDGSVIINYNGTWERV